MSLGTETRRIVENGEYKTPSGRVVRIAELVERAKAETVSVPPQAEIPREERGARKTRFSVVNETTMAAARKLREPLALNFASAKNPGGGWLGGARAQEESLARQSALVATLETCREMYEFHRHSPECLYTSWAIVSPRVPVFRGEDSLLLEEPWLCSFLTCAAPNAKVVLQRDARRKGEISAALKERVTRVLGIAAKHGYSQLVLGAWGCGVFGNDPEEVAAIFHAALTGPFAGAFEIVVFAIVDRWEDRRNIGPFERRFD